MKKLIFLTLIFIFNGAWASGASDSCEAPGRNVNLCYKMKLLRSQLNLLEGQKYLHQINYPLLQCFGNDMGQLTSSILLSSVDDEHLRSLNEVRAAAHLVAVGAADKDSTVFENIGKIRFQCMQCHAPTLPTSGIQWDSISGQSWAAIVTRCAKEGRNPYICQNMFGMLSGVDYLKSGKDSGVQNYQAILSAAEEIRRVASELRTQGVIHGGAIKLKNIEKEADSLMVLAQRQDPRVFRAVPRLVRSCVQCHGPSIR